MPITKTAFISAIIKNVRLLHEVAEVDTAPGRENVTLEMTDSTAVEARWEVTPKNEIVLVVVPSLDAVFKDQGSDQSFLIYKSKHDVRFLVQAHTNFDPNTELPSEAVAPYIEMALWIVKGRGVAAIRSMGLGQFSWPKSGDIESFETKAAAASSSEAPPKKRKTVAKKRTMAS